MKQIIALVIFVCASYGAQAQNKINKPAVIPAPTPKAANAANKTGHVAPTPTSPVILLPANNADKTGHVAPQPTQPSYGRKKG